MGARWTEADILAHNARMRRESASAAAEPKPSKYRNVRTVVDGITFDSKREAQHWAELKMRERAGDIRDLKRQQAFPLSCLPHDYVVVMDGDRAIPGVASVSTYVADYTYYDKAGAYHVVDAKGKRTAMYQLKKKWLELQSGVIIEEV